MNSEPLPQARKGATTDNTCNSRSVLLCEGRTIRFFSLSDQTTQLQVISRVGVTTLILVVVGEAVVDERGLPLEPLQLNLKLAYASLPRRIRVEVCKVGRKEIRARDIGRDTSVWKCAGVEP